MWGNPMILPWGDKTATLSIEHWLSMDYGK
jgi:hypothetical protein